MENIVVSKPHAFQETSFGFKSIEWKIKIKRQKKKERKIPKAKEKMGLKKKKNNWPKEKKGYEIQRCRKEWKVMYMVLVWYEDDLHLGVSQQIEAATSALAIYGEKIWNTHH